MSRDPKDTKKFSRRDFVKATATGVGAAALTGIGAQEADSQARSQHWDHEADVVVVGAGASGLPAAVEAAEHGASVIIVEANFDVGGHCILNGGRIALGGGTAMQKKYGIEDSPDIVFRDLTDWSVVEPNGAADYRYNDRELVRAFADNSAKSIEWLTAHDVKFLDQKPTGGGESSGNSAPRWHLLAPQQFALMQTGKPMEPEQAATTPSGVGLVRPLEARAKKAGVKILLKHHMSNLVREKQMSGRVIGLEADNEGKTVRIHARKGVIVTTGGSTSNVNFRRIWDVRLTEEYCGVSGEPWSFQDASGEIAGLAVGASLWGGYNNTAEFGIRMRKASWIGCRYGYFEWQPGSPVFNLAGAGGFQVRDYQNVILVNQQGLRFYDETKSEYTANYFHSNQGGQEPLDPYVPGSWLNSENKKWHPANFLNAALAGNGDPVNGGGPIWAIFDADAEKRMQVKLEPPHVDIANGFFYSAPSLSALAAAVGKNKYMRKPMPGAALESTVSRYNTFVDGGKDLDFAKPAPKYKLGTPPYYAAWATPVPHDSRAGMRINTKAQVIDFAGHVIPGLYSAGECSGGLSQHGMAKGIVFGIIAGRTAATETTSSKA